MRCPRHGDRNRKSLSRIHAGFSLYLPPTAAQGAPVRSTGGALAVLNVRQAAIASATPGGVRAGHDVYQGPVVRNCGICFLAQRARPSLHAISEPCMATKGRLQRLVSGHERGRNRWPWAAVCSETRATGCPWVASTYQRRGDSCRTPNQADGWDGMGVVVTGAALCRASEAAIRD